MEGRKIPEVVLKTRLRDDSIGGPNPFRWKDLNSLDLFRGKRVVVFSLPGAFTPTCSNRQCPAYDLVYDDASRDNDVLARNRAAILRSLIQQLAKHKLQLARASDQPPAPLPF